MWLMIGAAITAAACCLAAGRAVPWQGRQSAIAMALGMVLLAIFGAAPGVTLLVGVGWIASAMVGTIGLRGHAAARMCFHRAVGSVAMAACAFAALGGGSGSPPAQSAHAGHGVSAPFAVVSAIGVVAVLGMTLLDRRTHRRGAAHRRTRRLLEAEGAAMALGLVAMWAMPALS